MPSLVPRFELVSASPFPNVANHYTTGDHDIGRLRKRVLLLKILIFAFVSAANLYHKKEIQAIKIYYLTSIETTMNVLKT